MFGHEPYVNYRLSATQTDLAVQADRQGLSSTTTSQKLRQARHYEYKWAQMGTGLPTKVPRWE